jgi:hypothetical protein
LTFLAPKLAPLLTVIAQALHGIAWYIFFDKFQTEDDRELEFRSILMIVTLNAVNYNTFKGQLLLMTPAILIPHLLICNKVRQKFEVETDVTMTRLFNIFMLAFLLLLGHYLKQRDMAKIVIRKHMQEQSQ